MPAQQRLVCIVTTTVQMQCLQLTSLSACSGGVQLEQSSSKPAARDSDPELGAEPGGFWALDGAAATVGLS